MKETSKAHARRAATPLFQRAFNGTGIDIGGGDDPLQASPDFPGIVSVERFDREDGDAGAILRHRSGMYDFVYSSQTLEDFADPCAVIAQWKKLVAAGGYMVVTVPDFTLYEERQWPSRRNGAHKVCWGIGEDVNAPTGAYMNALRFLNDTFPAPWWKVWLLQLVDTNYDYSVRGADQTLGNAEAFIEFVTQRLQ